MSKNPRGDESLPDVSFTAIAIDLGETTGIAFLKAIDDVRTTSTKNPSHVFPIIEAMKPQVIILERFPENRSLPNVVEWVYGKLAEVSILVSPGEWKPFMKVQQKSSISTRNRHERDALDMLRYYCITSLQMEIP